MVCISLQHVPDLHAVHWVAYLCGWVPAAYICDSEEGVVAPCVTLDIDE